jgi:hypothetical protein
VQFNEGVEKHQVDNRKPPAKQLKKNSRLDASRQSTMDDASTATSATMSRKNAISKGVVNLES